MFRFVFRNFALGSACLPAKGMQELPNQLLNRLHQTQIRFNVPVSKVDQSAVVTLQNGEEIRAKKVIVACNPEAVLPQMKDDQPFHRTTTMYFSGSASLKKMNRTIGLDARKNSPINNYCRHDEVQPSCAPKGKSLWSVTVRDQVNGSAPEEAASLSELIGCQPKELSHLHSYFIKKALPIVASPRYDLPAEQTQIGPHIYLAGDYLLNGSIEAALRSGIRAAEAVTETLDLSRQV
jgi:phytoene dehydrogenase-like protein